MGMDPAVLAHAKKQKEGKVELGCPKLKPPMADEKGSF
jgi:hypothetical protein